MGKSWDASGIAYDAALWREVLRVLKPGAYLLAFGGSRTYHRLACAIEDAGFEIRDQIMWLYGSGFPKSLNCGEGRGTALKPAHEPIVMARKSLIGTVAENLEAHGTGALNIDACRVEKGPSDKPSGWAQTGSKASENIAMSGANYARDPTPDAGARWPANLIHDGSDEVLEAFPDAPSPRGDSGSAARFFYCAKASKADREDGCQDLPERTGGEITGRKPDSPGAIHSARAGMTQAPRRNTHPTVKPTALMCYLVRLVTPPGGTCLDPFMGSGSTGRACALEGFDFVGMELSPEYVQIAAARIQKALDDAPKGE